MSNTEFEIIDRKGGFITVDLGKDTIPMNIPGEEKSHLFYDTFEEVFIRNDYERGNCKIAEGDVVVDIGANIGLFSRLASLKGASKVYSFEPSPKTFSCLVRNAPPNCEPYNIGIMGTDGFFDMYVDNESQGNSFYLSNGNNFGKKSYTQKILCSSLTSLFDKGLINHINFLKVDSEGSERDLFRNLPDSYFDKIDKISMEYHNAILDHDGSCDELVARLSKWYNYVQKNTSVDELCHLYFWKDKLKIEEISKDIRVLGHASFIGFTGINNYTRDFFRALSKFVPTRVRNYTHVKDQSYLDELDHKILVQQFWGEPPYKAGTPDISISKEAPINIVLEECNHFYYYEKYDGVKIAYCIWESTLFPEHFFKKLHCYDQLWVPTNWQRDCVIKQGYPTDRVKVVPLGVDGTVFFPEEVKPLDEYSDGRFKFLLFGRWEYRKSTTEIIKTFLETFGKDEPIDLVCSIDNPYAVGPHKGKTTEELLEMYGLTDPRIKIKRFLSREDYIRYLKTGHVFVSCSRAEGFNLPLAEAAVCGIPTITSRHDSQKDFSNGVSLLVDTKEVRQARTDEKEILGEFIEPDFNSLSAIMRYAYEHYDGCKIGSLDAAPKIIKQFSWENAATQALQHINKLSPKLEPNKSSVAINYHFVDGAFLEILGNTNKLYKIKFIDKKENKEIYSPVIKSNNWVRPNRKYFTDWKLVVESDQKTIFEHDFNAKGKKVFIVIDSKGMGDSIAWFPYAAEFGKKHECKVIISSFMSSLFDKNYYADLTFVEPGNTVYDLYAQYLVGAFDNNQDRNKNEWRLEPLQKISSEILGLEYKEIKPKIAIPNPEEFNFDSDRLKGLAKNNKYICISEHSTMQRKYWNHSTGWQEVVDALKDKGYEIVVVSKEATELKNIKRRTSMPLPGLVHILNGASLFIGVSSGPVWLAWALDIPTIMIAGSSPRFAEFKETDRNIRIMNESVCHGCSGEPEYDFARGDWMVCPRKKNFECTKQILSGTVLDVAIKLLG